VLANDTGGSSAATEMSDSCAWSNKAFEHS